MYQAAGNFHLVDKVILRARLFNVLRLDLGQRFHGTLDDFVGRLLFFLDVIIAAVAHLGLDEDFWLAIFDGIVLDFVCIIQLFFEAHRVFVGLRVLVLVSLLRNLNVGEFWYH